MYTLQLCREPSREKAMALPLLSNCQWLGALADSMLRLEPKNILVSTTRREATYQSSARRYLPSRQQTSICKSGVCVTGIAVGFDISSAPSYVHGNLQCA